MLELAVLADDLTGGMIIASKLEAAGVVCPLITDVAALDELPTDPTAVVLARKIRLSAPELARDEARRAAAAFKKRGARTIYFKYSALFDSTDRGNIGPIAETLVEETGAARTMFCPAYIDRGATMYKGHVFVGAALLAESPKRFDPVTPADTSNLVAKLKAQTSWPVDLIDHQTLVANRAAAAFDAQPDCPFWLVDSLDEADVARVAALSRGWPLVTGGDSLPPAIIRDRFSAASPEPGSGRRLLTATPGAEVVISGSCARPTLAQLDAFAERHPIWRVDLEREGDEAGLDQRIANWAAARLPAGPVAIATSAEPEAVAAAQARFGREGASLRADRLLAAVATRLGDLGVTKFVIAGGETTGEVFAALGVRRFEVGGYDDLFGGYCCARRRAPLSFVLKPGLTGGISFFFNALERMRSAERQTSGVDDERR